MRMGTPRSLASAATCLISTSLRRLPGLSRRPWTPASSAASAISWWKWMSAMIGHGRAGHDPGQALRRRLLVAGAPDQVGAGRGQRVDLGQGGLGVGRLGGGHRLDGDRCAAAHGHLAHMDLPGGSAFGGGPGRSSHGPMLGREGPAPAGGGQPKGLATGWKMSVSRAGTTRMAMTRMNSQVNGISLATSAWYMTLRRPVRIFS